MRALAWILFIAAFLSMCAVLVGVFPPFQYLEYVPMTLGILGVVTILIHDTRKAHRRE